MEKRKYGRITVLGIAGQIKGHTQATGVCDCGSKWAGRLSSLINGDAKSCGCLRIERIKQANTTHGMEGSPEYGAWKSIKERVFDQRHPAYHNYGGRGIGMFEGWVSDFSAFVSHVGRRPEGGYSIERVNNELGYIPGNVVWATRKEQNNNRRTNVVLEHLGVRLTITQWAERLGVRKGTLQQRIKLGWSVQRVLDTPVRAKCKASTALQDSVFGVNSRQPA